MLSNDIAGFTELRQSLGFKFRVEAGLLRNFARFAEGRGDFAVRSQTAMDWAAEAPSVAQRRARLNLVRRFALHMQADDERYEVPSPHAFGKPCCRRRTPYIYTPDEIQRLLQAAGQLTPAGSSRPNTYVALLALLVSTGLRISEALALQFEDIAPDGLVVRNTKFRKSRLLPLHPTARCGLDRYLVLRRKIMGSDNSVFVSLWGTGLSYSTVRSVFLELARKTGLRGGPGTPGPTLHDIRHTFAVRSLEACGGGDDEIARHVLALSTYLGHAHPSDTYWYLEATPKLLEGIRRASEDLFKGGRP
jgi:integrase